MVYLVRVIQALGGLVNSVSVELAAADQPVKLQAASAGKTQLTDGIPYMLRNSRSVVCCHLVRVGIVASYASCCMTHATHLRPNTVACCCYILQNVCRMVHSQVLLSASGLAEGWPECVARLGVCSETQTS